MLLSTLITGKIFAGKLSTGKVAGISACTSAISDLTMGTITYHYWDKKKRKSFKVKRKHKRRW